MEPPADVTKSDVTLPEANLSSAGLSTSDGATLGIAEEATTKVPDRTAGELQATSEPRVSEVPGSGAEAIKHQEAAKRGVGPDGHVSVTLSYED